MAERSNTKLVLLALGGLYLLTKPRAGAVAPGPSSATSSDGETPSVKTAGDPGGGGGIGSSIKAVSEYAKPIGAGAGIVATAAGVTTPAVVGGALFIAAGAVAGYELAGPVGGVVGGLNPILGNAVILGAKGGSAAVKAIGGNEAAQDTGAVGGGVLAGVATLADIAAAAALLPTIGLAVLFAEILGAIFGSDPPAPPTPGQQVDALYQVALGPRGSYRGLFGQFLGPHDQVNAAAQLVALSNGPKQFTIYTPAAQQVPNPFRDAARGRAQNLGLAPLFDDYVARSAPKATV